ncbi:MAG: hypothetical protein NVSMB70_01720 [Chamaesiphon sp.]
MAAFLAPFYNAGQQIFNSQGVPLAGGLLNVYAAGSVTKTDTWTDSTQATKNPNPIVLDASGRVPSAIWLQSGTNYKFVVQNSVGVQVGSAIDYVSGVNDSTSTNSQWIPTGTTPTFINTTSFSVPGDQRNTYQVGRRTQCSVTAGTIYATIATSTFASNVTTVTQTNDSGVLDSGLTTANVGLISSVNTSVPPSQSGITAAQQQQQSNIAFITGGTATAYTLTPSPGIGSYLAGIEFDVTFNAANGITPTLTINALASPPNLVKAMPDGTVANLAPGDVPINWRSKVVLLSATQALVRQLPSGDVTGMLRDFAGATTPAGFLACDGTAYSRTTYAALFAVIGTTWGAGDGSTTFNVPDLRGRTAIGSGTGAGLTARTLGTQNIGEEAHTLTVAELAVHSHGVNESAHTHASFISDPGHSHSGGEYTGQNTLAGGALGTYARFAGAAGNNTGAASTGISLTNASATTGITVANAGSGNAHNNMQPSAVVLKIIKA